MIWLTWRQFRLQFLAGLAVLVLLTLYLLYLGDTIRVAYNTDILDCVAANGCKLTEAKSRFVRDFTSPVQTAGILVMVIPALLGLFWGTPMITRELETNTHKLVWNQSVTRTRWLAVKLTLVGLFAMAVTGGLSLALTWAASRFDQVQGNRFVAIAFASRNVAPLGYAAFAFVLGITVGLFVRRTVPAMAVTLALIGLIQFVVPIVTRPHLRAPVKETVTYTTAVSTDRGGFINIGPNSAPLRIDGYTIPGALMLTKQSFLYDSSGNKVTSAQVKECLNGQEPIQTQECIAKKNLHFETAYQPAKRYWTFQWTEFGGFLALTVALSALAFWRVKRVRG